MQSFCSSVRLVQRHALASSTHAQFTSGTYMRSTRAGLSSPNPDSLLPKFLQQSLVAVANKPGHQSETWFSNGVRPSVAFVNARSGFQLGGVGYSLSSRCITSEAESVGSPIMPEIAPRIKFKRLDKTAKHIMQILDKEMVEEVKATRDIPDVKPGYIVQLKVEAPENKRRVSVVKGIVIARRNAGLNTTFRIRRLVAGVGVESLFPLYSPSIKEIKVLDKKKVRRAKLYYLRDKMNALKKH